MANSSLAKNSKENTDSQFELFEDFEISSVTLNGVITFTLPVKQSKNQLNQLSNLVLSYKNDTLVKSHIFKYQGDFKLNDKENRSSGILFYGKLKIISVDNNVDLFAKTSNCYPIDLLVCSWVDPDEGGGLHFAGANCTAAFISSMQFTFCPDGNNEVDVSLSEGPNTTGGTSNGDGTEPGNFFHDGSPWASNIGDPEHNYVTTPVPDPPCEQDPLSLTEGGCYEPGDDELPELDFCVVNNSDGCEITISNLTSEIEALITGGLTHEEKIWITSNPINAQQANEIYSIWKNRQDPDPEIDFKLFFRIALKFAMNNGFDVGVEAQNLLIEEIKRVINDVHPGFAFLLELEIATQKRDHPEWNNRKLFYESMISTAQLTLDVVGLAPGIGEPADLINGLIYSVRGDGLNASLSYASLIPFAGWGSASIKMIRRYDRITKVTFAISYDVATETYKFLGRSGKLRKALGMIPGDPRQAHHIIPQEFIDHPAVQKAAGQGFHIDEALNGIPLETIRHSGSHSNYSNIIRRKLGELDLRLNGNDFMREFTAEITDIENIIRDNPSVPINQLIF
jgi:hypothetical protein